MGNAGMTQAVLRIEPMADRVMVRLMTIAENRTMELSIDQAERVLASLCLAVAEAKAFVPGKQPFTAWGL